MGYLAITPSDSVSLPIPVRALWAGTAGTIALLGLHDTAPVTFASFPAGVWVTFSINAVAQVLATGTTCTGLVGASVKDV